MGTYFIAQGTLLNTLWCPEWGGNLKGRGYMYICIYMADSLFCTVESNIVKQLYSNKN